MATVQYVWHFHHSVLVEALTEPIEARIADIKWNKPIDEQALRLRLLHLVKGQLPTAFVDASLAYHEARATYYGAGATYYGAEVALGKARANYYRVQVACSTEINALHAVECPGCPWNGLTIFPKVIANA